MPPRKADKSEAQVRDSNKDHVENAKELEKKAREEGDVDSRREADERQREVEKDDDFQPGNGRDEAESAEEVREERAEASKATETEETHLASDALELRDETLERAKKPFDTSNLIAQRAVFDTSGVAGEADHDMRRAYPAYDLDALDRQDVPEHLAKYIVSDEGLPAVLKREEELRKDAPSTKKSKKS
jgi:hypothetical protein